MLNKRTGDTSDQSYSSQEEAEEAARQCNERFAAKAAELKAMQKQATERQAAIEAIRPSTILTNGNDR